MSFCKWLKLFKIKHQTHTHTQRHLRAEMYAVCIVNNIKICSYIYVTKAKWEYFHSGVLVKRVLLQAKNEQQQQQAIKKKT